MFARFCSVVLLTLVGLGPLLAAEPAAELRALLDGFYGHRRVALGYLRAENTDLAAIEIEHLRGQWAADLKKLPAALASERDLAAALASTDAAVAQSLATVDAGEGEKAREQLRNAANALDAWRRAHGLRQFSDCVGEIGDAYRSLDAYRVTAPNLADAATRDHIRAALAATESALARCDKEAPAEIGREPEFRRLIDGMAASLRQMPDALGKRDNDYLHRLLIEQRAFDELLAFRFG